MLALLLPLLLLPRPMPPASVPPPDSDLWPAFLTASPLCDRERFPPAWAVESARDFNGRHRVWLAAELEYELDPRRRSILRNWEREALALYRVWDLLDDARHGGYPAWRQRVALGRLREAIGDEAFGDEAFDAGEMPPVVPVWRFREMSR